MKSDVIARGLLQIALALSTFGAAGTHAAPLALSDTPLSASISIDPNVMLLIDNSGSMEHMVWDDRFNPDGNYSAWQYQSSNSNNYYADLSDSASSYLFPSNIYGSGCTSGFKRFRLGSIYKCLKLPEPNGSSNTRYSQKYLRFLLDTFASGTDLTQGQIPADHRMKVARDVATDLVRNTPGMRFGVSHFNLDQGGSIAAVCGSSTSTLVNEINALNADSWTPLAESLYEITRYFRGMTSYYSSKIPGGGSTYTSPIQYRCQKNFTVVITDGEPTYDASFPANDPDDVADTTRSLPNWDNNAANDSLYGASASNSGSEGYSYLLDDIALFAWDIDMRKGGTDEAGGSFDDPDFLQQNMYTYTIGFTIANDMLSDAAEYGHGLYFTADNAEQLRESLGEALTDIQSKLGSASSATSSQGSLSTATRIYQGRMNSADWTGQLLSFAVDASSGELLTNGSGPEGSLWDAGSKIGNPGTRAIITNKTGGVPFQWGSFTTQEQIDYFNGQQNLLSYLRGSSFSAYRSRASLLGDIVNSAVQYVGPPESRYSDSMENAAYSTFKKTYAGRIPMIYVGSNDGMLHGFNADTGEEKFAYIPSVLLDNLKHLTDPDYNESHKFYVDGTPTVVDAFIGGAWKTVLAGGLNKGGQGIYALNVTSPTQLSENNAGSIFLWEFTDADDADLGYTYSRPAIVKLQNGIWAAVFGNGYNNTVSDDHTSTTGNAALYVVNLQTGALIKKISTNTGIAQDPAGEDRPNGLATVSPVDLNNDGKVDYVYAGDLFGNLWKFDFSGNNAGDWKLAYKLFQASCTGSNCDSHQPVTTKPTVIQHPNKGGQIVLFGTGKYLEQADNISINGGVQSFYAIWDNGNPVSAPVSRSRLQQQRIIYEQSYTFTDPDGNEIVEGLRVTTDYSVNWNTQSGWYLDLVSPNGFEGERQVTDSLVRSGRLIFTTMIPSDSSDPCAPSGTSWIMEMDAVSGSRLTYSPFDLNADGLFSTADYVTVVIDGKTVTVPATGRKTKGGYAQTPGVVANGDREIKYISTSEGLEVMLENAGHLLTGRQNWQELIPREE